MPIEILMPALSPTMEEGTLAKWLVKEGDTVASGDIIAEIETDKATMEFEAVDDGTIGKIIVPEGSEGVKVNALIAVLLEDGEEASDAVLSYAPAEDAGDKAATTAVSAEPATPNPEPSTSPVPAAPGTRPPTGGSAMFFRGCLADGHSCPSCWGTGKSARPPWRWRDRGRDGRPQSTAARLPRFQPW